MRVLGIETSCDETAASVVENGRKILSNIVFSQEKIHRPFKGIVPEIASRTHLENINKVIEQACSEAQFIKRDHRTSPPFLKGDKGGFISSIDAVAVTVGPGLVGSLLIGKMTAEAMGWAWNKPVVGVNHLEAHLFANCLEKEDLAPPFLGLIVSGGHTDLVLVEHFGVYRVLGRTRDDAAGECYDKAAKILGLGYPGGPLIDKLSAKGDPDKVKFTRPFLKGSWDFSFSGLKTAVLYYLRDNFKLNGSPNISPFSKGGLRGIYPSKIYIADVCASFQRCVVDVLVEKTISAALKFGQKKVVVGGGVSANSELRKRFLMDGKKRGLKIYLPSIAHCTDNAAMVASAGFFKLRKTFSHCSASLVVDPSMPLQNWPVGAS